MNKCEYITRRNELQKQLYDLRHEYITSNIDIPIGSKVNVIAGNGDCEKGVLYDYDVDLMNDVVPIVAKENKDGSPHTTARIYVGLSRVELR